MTCPRLVRAILLFCILLAAVSASSQSRIDCSAINSRILSEVMHYCVYLPSGYDASAAEHPAKRYPVLYFLHGLGDNERTLFNSGGWTMLDDLRNKHELGDFLIVAPEGRRSFYVNSADGKFPYSDFFLRELMPHIERKYRIRPGRAQRAISGVSMGGYGALRFAFAHPELFSSVSAQGAALMPASPKQLDAAANAGAPMLSVLQPVFGSPINVAHWNANNPFVLARQNAAGLRKMPIYFNCGQDDNYGFERGAAALHAELDREHIKHEFHLYPGDHSMTYFLSHFAEVLEFHSKAFGLTSAR